MVQPKSSWKAPRDPFGAEGPDLWGRQHIILGSGGPSGVQRPCLQGPWGEPCSSWIIKGGEGIEHERETGEDSHWQSTPCPARPQPCLPWASRSQNFSSLPDTPIPCHPPRIEGPHALPRLHTISVGAHWHWSSCLPPTRTLTPTQASQPHLGAAIPPPPAEVLLLCLARSQSRHLARA